MARSKDASRSYAQVFTETKTRINILSEKYSLTFRATRINSVSMSRKKYEGEQKQIWAVRGIPMETRSAAMSTARRADMTLGEWLAKVVNEAVVTQNSTRNVPAPRIEEVLNKMLERLEALETTPRPRGFWDWMMGRKSVTR